MFIEEKKVEKQLFQNKWHPVNITFTFIFYLIWLQAETVLVTDFK